MTIQDDIVAALPDLRRFAAKLTRDRQRVDDLVHDTVLRALENAHSFHGGNFRAWCFRIMHNLNIDQGTRNVVRPTVKVDDLFDMAAPPRTQDHMVLRDVAAALDRMKPERAAVVLLVAQEFRYDEISALLGIPLGTVMSRLARARKALIAEVLA